MTQYDYIVLGAGPAGLTLACRLQQLAKKEKISILLLEKEKEAGGLCRSVDVDGAPLDIGGGHFLDDRRLTVNQFLFQYMDEREWNLYVRDSRIMLHNQLIAYPIESNIWQLPLEEQILYLKSIAISGGNLDQPKPESFVDWISWKLGKRIAEEYMLPYNRKLYGTDLNSLGTYWLEKLPQVSFEETLLSCLQKKAYGKNPGHTNFYYPKKYGFGELWKRMADSIYDRIRFQSEVVSVNMSTKKVCCKDGSFYYGKRIITTIPWKSFESEELSENLKGKIQHLKHCGIVINYCPENINVPAHWIYYPNEQLSYHRTLLRHNFCPGSKGYWSETNAERFTENENFFHFNEYAYPLNTIEKPDIMRELLDFTKKRQIFGLGRWGEHQHYNADVVVERALNLADRLWEDAI